jgi:hypothetical protein
MFFYFRIANCVSSVNFLIIMTQCRCHLTPVCGSWQDIVAATETFFCKFSRAAEKLLCFSQGTLFYGVNWLQTLNNIKDTPS